jgi:glycosyltransferase involved in cell wall biosynthesis
MRARVPVAVFLSSFHADSAERQTIELIRRLNRSRFDVHVACFRAEGTSLPAVEQAAASVTPFPVRGFGRASTLTEARRFARWCREHDVKVLYTADLESNIFAIPPAAIAGVPVRIASRRQVTNVERAGRRALQRAAYSWAQVVVAHSAAAADRLAEERVPRSRVRVIPDGIDLRAYTPRGTERPIRTIATVGSLRPERGHDVLLEAAPMVLRRFPDLEIVIAGDGPRRSELEAMARRLGIGAHVRFPGRTEPLSRLFARCDAFVLPARADVSPAGVIEAMACGLPVIASRVDGVRELIEHQRTGVLVPPGDPRALGYALLDLVQWNSHALAIGRAARSAVEARYSLDRRVAAHERLYFEELERHAVVTPAASEVIAS